jgi:hypothetical protein
MQSGENGPRDRHKDGAIALKFGNTLIRTLREAYGHGFAEGCNPNGCLSLCLHQLDDESLSQLARDLTD